MGENRLPLIQLSNADAILFLEDKGEDWEVGHGKCTDNFRGGGETHPVNFRKPLAELSASEYSTY
jgi:hypothetical protein